MPSHRYGRGGWDIITPELLQSLGIPLPADLNSSQTQQELQSNPVLLDYQRSMLRKRVGRLRNLPSNGCSFGEPGRDALPLSNTSVSDFADWLQSHYGTIVALQQAWQYPYRNISTSEFTTFQEAALLMTTTATSEDFRRSRDTRRFVADNYIRCQ
jgi:hypothetical protein